MAGLRIQGDPYEVAPLGNEGWHLPDLVAYGRPEIHLVVEIVLRYTSKKLLQDPATLRGRLDEKPVALDGKLDLGAGVQAGFLGQISRDPDRQAISPSPDFGFNGPCLVIRPDL